MERGAEVVQVGTELMVSKESVFCKLVFLALSP